LSDKIIKMDNNLILRQNATATKQYITLMSKVANIDGELERNIRSHVEYCIFLQTVLNNSIKHVYEIVNNIYK